MKNLNSFKAFAILLVIGLQFFCSGCEDLLLYDGESWYEATLYVKDVDGNLYKTVKIGDQRWMAENLKTTKFNDSTSIPLVTDNTEWKNLTTPGLSWYNNDDTINKALYGGLYNWETVATEKICPAGWHVPTDPEWTTLTDYLTNNGYGYEGSGNDIAKSMASQSGWLTNPSAGNLGNDQASNNSSGFTALPSGFRNIDGRFMRIDFFTGWWSSIESSTSRAWYRSLDSNLNYVIRADDFKSYGAPIRCVRD